MLLQLQGQQELVSTYLCMLLRLQGQQELVSTYLCMVLQLQGQQELVPTPVTDVGRSEVSPDVDLSLRFVVVNLFAESAPERYLP